jgi:hypothetical protein
MSGFARHVAALAAAFRAASLYALAVAFVQPCDAHTQAPAPAASPAAQSMAQAQRFIAAQKFDSAVTLLNDVLKLQPNNAQAMMSLGAAERGRKDVGAATAALERALNFPRARPRALQSLFLLHAAMGTRDDAFRWFDTLRQTGGTDLTLLASSPDVATLASDARFAVLFPARIDFAKPFVEPTRIIHEWRGERAGDEFGWIARGVGDVDRDGVTDITVSATQNRPMGIGAGKVYLYSGKRGTLLWKHDGQPNSALGIGLEAAGDVNRDGVPDVVAGAPGLNAVLLLSGRDGKELLRLRGDSADLNLGATVAGIGDVNGDGYDDVAGGAPGRGAAGPGSPGAGRVYVFSGKDGARLLTIDGKPGESLGSTVGGGSGTLIVGASAGGAARTGRVYVYKGTTPEPAFTLDADSTGAALGAMFVSIAGDVDRDGTPDIYATDFANSAKGPSTGRAYVYSGKTGATLRTFTGEVAGEGFGIGAARSGDVNGDGFADLAVGSWQYGGAAWSGGRVQVLSGADGKVLQSFTGRVPGETLGFDAVGVGDVDGDGTTDYLLTSAWSMVNGVRSGRVYIVAGKVRK